MRGIGQGIERIKSIQLSDIPVVMNKNSVQKVRFQLFDLSKLRSYFSNLTLKFYRVFGLPEGKRALKSIKANWKLVSDRNPHTHTHTPLSTPTPLLHLYTSKPLQRPNIHTYTSPNQPVLQQRKIRLEEESCNSHVFWSLWRLLHVLKR